MIKSKSIDSTVSGLIDPGVGGVKKILFVGVWVLELLLKIQKDNFCPRVINYSEFLLVPSPKLKKSTTPSTVLNI